MRLNDDTRWVPVNWYSPVSSRQLRRDPTAPSTALTASSSARGLEHISRLMSDTPRARPTPLAASPSPAPAESFLTTAATRGAAGYLLRAFPARDRPQGCSRFSRDLFDRPGPPHGWRPSLPDTGEVGGDGDPCARECGLFDRCLGCGPRRTLYRGEWLLFRAGLPPLPRNARLIFRTSATRADAGRVMAGPIVGSSCFGEFGLVVAEPVSAGEGPA